MGVHLIASLLTQAITVLGLDRPLRPWNLGALEPCRPPWLDRVLVPPCPIPWDIDTALVLDAFPPAERDGIRRQIEVGFGHLVELSGQSWQPADPTAVVQVRLGIPLVGREQVLVRICTENTFGPDNEPIHGEYHAWLDREGRLCASSRPTQQALAAVWPLWVVGRSPGLDARVNLNHASLQQLQRLPGLNRKTVQAIMIARQYRDEWPLLVFAPTSMCLPWCEELERWCPFLRPGDINLVRSHHNGALRKAPVTIISYGLLTNGKEKERLGSALLAAGFRVAIADEAHYLKSKDAQRTKLLTPLLKAARRCIVLTGTPALNRPVELFTLLQCVAPKQPAWRTYTAYTERYCAARMAYFGRARRLDVKGSSNEAGQQGESALLWRRQRGDGVPPDSELAGGVWRPQHAGAAELRLRRQMPYAVLAVGRRVVQQLVRLEVRVRVRHGC